MEERALKDWGRPGRPDRRRRRACLSNRQLQQLPPWFGICNRDRSTRAPPQLRTALCWTLAASACRHCADRGLCRPGAILLALPRDFFAAQAKRGWTRCGQREDLPALARTAQTRWTKVALEPRTVAP